MSTTNLPQQDHLIDVTTAAAMTKRYRDNKVAILKTEYQTSDVLPLNETFNKQAFANFMNNENCKALRIYYGMDENLGVHAIIVGVNASNEDMLPSVSLTSTSDTEDVLLEDSQRCPPSCPPSSVLNEG